MHNLRSFLAEPHYRRCLFLGFCFPTLLSMMVPHPRSPCPHSSQLAEGRGRRTLLLTCHWPDLVIWPHSAVRMAGKCSLFWGGAAMCLSSILENEEDSVEREVAACHSHLSHEDHSLIYFPPAGGSWHISSATSCSFFFFFNFTFRGGKGLQCIQRGVRLAETQGATCHGLFRETAHYNLSN